MASDVYTRFGVDYRNVPTPQTLTDGEGDSLANDIELQDTAQVLPLSVTAEQYTKLLSAALNGANRYFPEDYIEVIYPLIKAAKVSDTFCEAIAECIENPESGTYSALNDWLLNQLLNNSEVRNQINGIGSSGTDPVPGTSTALIEDCDPDNLFGFCRQVVQVMNRLVLDAFEVLEVITNTAEFALAVAELIPPATVVVSYVNYLQNTLVENYLANYDVAYENEVACGLFCLARANEGCTLNWFQITDYFADRLSTSVEGITIDDCLSYIVTGAWSGDQYCDASMLSLAFILQLGGDWTGISFANIQLIVQSFLNDPDEDWLTLCPCGWSFQENFVSSTGVFDWTEYGAGWTPSTRGDLGTEEDLIDTQNVYTPLDRRFEGIAITCEIASTANFTRCRFEYEAGIDGVANSSVKMYNGAVEVYDYTFEAQDTDGTPEMVDLEMNVTADRVVISLVSGFKVGSNPASSCNLPYVLFQGGGTIPPEFT
jgi:hypothetical protein